LVDVIGHLHPSTRFDAEFGSQGLKRFLQGRVVGDELLRSSGPFAEVPRVRRHVQQMIPDVIDPVLVSV
jgi:hypothetical protein